jgi:muramoyltetrapeptide carboxypeptidase
MSKNKVLVLTPARFVTPEIIAKTIDLADNEDIALRFSSFSTIEEDQFAGSDEQRVHDFIREWNDGDADVIWCGRGGYGSGRLLNHLRGKLAKNGKVLIGYSDITYLLALVGKNGIGKAVHGPMPVDLTLNKPNKSVRELFRAIRHNDFSFSLKNFLRHQDIPSPVVLQKGEAHGKLIVGSLSILTRLIGTPEEPDWTGSILAVEDVDEYLYAVDRMFLHLSAAGVLAKISGLIVGSFTDTKDNEVPFGQTVPEIALGHLKDRNIPVLMGVPFGHGNFNVPLIYKGDCHLKCSEFIEFNVI